MTTRWLVVAGVTIGITLFAYFSFYDFPANIVEPHNSEPNTSFLAHQTKSPGSDVKRVKDHQRNDNVINSEEENAIRVVPVFDSAFNVRVYPSWLDTTFRSPPDQPIADRYDALARAAHTGDGDAALELSLTLKRCVGFATTEAELNKKLDVMNQTHLVEGPFDRPRFIDDIQPMVKLEQQRFNICKGILKEQILAYDEWLILAAGMGNYNAQMGAFQTVLEKHWPGENQNEYVDSFDGVVGIIRQAAKTDLAALQHVIEFTFAAQSQGSLQALADLAGLYAAGVLQPGNGHSALANAYANLLAATEVWQQIWNPGSYSYDEDLHRLSNSLSIYEADWAEAEAQTILRDSNCCIEW